MNEELHSEQEIAAFMKSVADPDFKASMQPITIAEADKIRQSMVQLNQKLNLVLQKLSAQKQTIEVNSKHIEDLELRQKETQEHYKVFNDFRAEVVKRLKKLELRIFNKTS